MAERLTGLAELRLLIHGWPKHTTVALVTRTRMGSENWDRRSHSWDLPLPQGDYENYAPEDQLWCVLAALASRTSPRRQVSWAEPSAPPSGGHGGEQLTLDRALGLT